MYELFYHVNVPLMGGHLVDADSGQDILVFIPAKLPRLKNAVPPMRGHLQCRDTFAWIQECPLKRGTIVHTNWVNENTPI